MKSTFILASAMTAALTASIVSGAMAQQTTGQTYTTQTTTTQQTVYPSSLSGTVESEVTSEKGWLWMDAVHKTINLAKPTAGQFTHDDLGVGNRLILTLVNPTDNPMQFETSQRLGEEYSWIVQPRSQKIVSFIYTKPLSDEVHFLVSDLGNPPSDVTAARQAEAIRMQAATIQSQQATIQSQASAMQPAQAAAPMTQPGMVESQSAVRGFW